MVLKELVYITFQEEALLGERALRPQSSSVERTLERDRALYQRQHEES